MSACWLQTFALSPRFILSHLPIQNGKLSLLKWQRGIWVHLDVEWGPTRFGGESRAGLKLLTVTAHCTCTHTAPVSTAQSLHMHSRRQVLSCTSQQMQTCHLVICISPCVALVCTFFRRNSIFMARFWVDFYFRTPNNLLTPKQIICSKLFNPLDHFYIDLPAPMLIKLASSVSVLTDHLGTSSETQHQTTKFNKQD